MRISLSHKLRQMQLDIIRSCCARERRKGLECRHKASRQMWQKVILMKSGNRFSESPGS